MDQLHPNSLGYHNKDVSEKYAYARPSYPQEAIDFIKNKLNLNLKETVVVDLAAGTGKFTELLVGAGFKNVTAVEPSPQFREQCQNLIDRKFKDDNDLKFNILEGMSTSIPLKDSSVDLLCSAQAFHWFANFESIKEISRVLKPNGILLLIWNSFDNVANVQYSNIMETFKSNGKFSNISSPMSQTKEWKKIFQDNENNQEFKNLLNPILELNCFKYENITNSDKTISAILSISFVALFPQDVKDKLVEKLKETMETSELTSNGKEFPIYYTTELYITRKPSNPN